MQQLTKYPLGLYILYVDVHDHMHPTLYDTTATYRIYGCHD